MRKAVLAVVIIVALLAVIVLVDGFRSESCQCQYIGPCEFDAQGGYRYYQCGGSCAAYSSWHYYPRCLDPNYKPRQLLS